MAVRIDSVPAIDGGTAVTGREAESLFLRSASLPGDAINVAGFQVAENLIQLI